MGGLEDKFLGLPGEAFRKVENGVMLGIDQFDLAVQVLPAAGFYRRERDIIDVIVAVVILLRGRKHEPRAADHPVDRLAGTIDPGTVCPPNRCTSLWIGQIPVLLPDSGMYKVSVCSQ